MEYSVIPSAAIMMLERAEQIGSNIGLGRLHPEIANHNTYHPEVQASELRIGTR
jgi:hypothetical protein